MDHRGIGDDGDIGAGAFHVGLADRHDIVFRRQNRLHAPIEELVLEINHRVGIADRRLQESLGVIRCGRSDDFEPRRMKEPAFRAFRMERPAVHPAAKWRADDQRHRRAPTIVVLGRHLGDLIEGAGDKIGELHLHDGAHAHHSRADRGSHEPGLGQRRVQHAPLAVLFLEAFRNPERAAVRPDVLPHEKHPLVAGHLFIERLRDGLQIGDFLSGRGRGHGSTSSSVAKTPSKVSRPSGSGLCSANSTPASTSLATRLPTSWNIASSA